MFLIILVTSFAEFIRGLNMKLPAAIAVGVAFTTLSFFTEIGFLLSILSGIVVIAGFYICAMTTPRPLFGALHGRVDPAEWEFNIWNRWMLVTTKVFADPHKQGYRFGIIYGALRGLYAFFTSAGIAAIHQNPWMIAVGAVGLLQGLCYRLASILMPDNEYNPALARFLWGTVYGVMLYILLNLGYTGISADN